MDFFTLRNRRNAGLHHPLRRADGIHRNPDRAGALGHILLGFEDVAGYEHAGGSFGRGSRPLCQPHRRCAFHAGRQEFQLDRNDNGNILHGGAGGFGNRYWELESFTEGEAPQLALKLTSPDGDQGFPGRLTCRARSIGWKVRSLHLELSAAADAPTVINLSSHPYFNLAGVDRQRYYGPSDHHQRGTFSADRCGTDPDWRVASGRRHPF